jgi:RNA polymerase sigma-70 factor (ECF subfamily)
VVTAVEDVFRDAWVAEVEGPEVALAIVDGLPLDGYRYLHATRAELLRRLGGHDEAETAYRRALELVDDDVERRHLQRRLQTLRAAARQGCDDAPGGAR